MNQKTMDAKIDEIYDLISEMYPDNHRDVIIADNTDYNSPNGTYCIRVNIKESIVGDKRERMNDAIISKASELGIEVIPEY